MVKMSSLTALSRWVWIMTKNGYGIPLYPLKQPSNGQAKHWFTFCTLSDIDNRDEIQAPDHQIEVEMVIYRRIEVGMYAEYMRQMYALMGHG